jgi:hypothetical protein
LIDRYGSPAVEFKIYGTDITVFVTHLSPEIDGKYPILDLAGVTLEEYNSAISEFRKSYNPGKGIGKSQVLELRHNPFFEPGDDIPMKVALEGLTRWPHIHTEIRLDKSISPTGYANPALFLNCDD